MTHPVNTQHYRDLLVVECLIGTLTADIATLCEDLNADDLFGWRVMAEIRELDDRIQSVVRNYASQQEG